MKFEVKLSDALTPEGRDVREEVFVREQGYEVEFDELDGKSRHALLFAGGEPMGAGRAYPSEDSAYVIGRLAIRKSFRGNGAGREVLFALEADCRASGGSEIRLNAQNHAVPFYQKCGYSPTGETILDEQRRHTVMRKDL